MIFPFAELPRGHFRVPPPARGRVPRIFVPKNARGRRPGETRPAGQGPAAECPPDYLPAPKQQAARGVRSRIPGKDIWEPETKSEYFYKIVLSFPIVSVYYRYYHHLQSYDRYSLVHYFSNMYRNLI